MFVHRSKGPCSVCTLIFTLSLSLVLCSYSFAINNHGNRTSVRIWDGTVTMHYAVANSLEIGDGTDEGSTGSTGQTPPPPQPTSVPLDIGDGTDEGSTGGTGQTPPPAPLIPAALEIGDGTDEGSTGSDPTGTGTVAGETTEGSNLDIGDGTDEGSTGSGNGQTPPAPMPVGGSPDPASREGASETADEGQLENLDIGDGTDEGSTGTGGGGGKRDQHPDSLGRGKDLSLEYHRIRDTRGSWLVGVFRGTLVLGADALTCETNEVFVGRTDHDGHILWVDQLYGSGDDRLQSVLVCENGDLVLAGSYTGDLEALPQAKGLADGFIARVTKSGELLWLQNLSCHGFAGVDALIENAEGKLEFSLRQADQLMPDKFVVLPEGNIIRR